MELDATRGWLAGSGCALGEMNRGRDQGQWDQWTGAQGLGRGEEEGGLLVDGWHQPSGHHGLGRGLGLGLGLGLMCCYLHSNSGRGRVCADAAVIWIPTVWYIGPAPAPAGGSVW